MSKNGRARILDTEQFAILLDQIAKHRHPEKNTLIIQISFKLGLRVQEISLLRISEVAEIGPEFTMGYKIKDLLTLPKGFTESALVTSRNKAIPVRRSVRFSLEKFDSLVRDIVKFTKAGVEVKPEDFYPILKPKGGKTRELPIKDDGLIKALCDYIELRLINNSNLKPSDPLILSQKNGPYSPNTLQEHMGMMLRNWAHIDRASSHSGRRSLATKLIFEQKQPLKIVQEILGHTELSTSVIYTDLPDGHIRGILNKVGKTYDDE